ncbi:MAG: extracellular solute-binding protein, partial [Rhodothermales bacterium]|nr:extracellular solute-binding protein [Rhodothermales bacterium]
MKRWLVHILIVPLVASFLLSCGGGSSKSSDGKTIVRLHLLLISTKQVEHFQWIESTYEAQNPDVDVLFEQFPGSSLKDYEIKLKLGLASKKAPDVVGVGHALAEELARLGFLSPAPDNIVDRVAESSTNEMVRTAPVFNGIHYGIVSDATPTALFYNRSMFAESGLDPDRPPQTMTELIDFA